MSTAGPERTEESLTPSRVCRSVRDPLAPVPGVCVGVRKRRINNEAVFSKPVSKLGFSLEGEAIAVKLFSSHSKLPTKKM